jgi:hypothetical protein
MQKRVGDKSLGVPERLAATRMVARMYGSDRQAG